MTVAAAITKKTPTVIAIKTSMRDWPAFDLKKLNLLMLDYKFMRPVELMITDEVATTFPKPLWDFG